MEPDFEIPLYSRDLIKKLDEVFPHRTPGLKDTERTIFHYAGMRELVDYLLVKVREEESHSIDPTEAHLT